MIVQKISHYDAGCNLKKYEFNVVSRAKTATFLEFLNIFNPRTNFLWNRSNSTSNRWDGTIVHYKWDISLDRIQTMMRRICDRNRASLELRSLSSGCWICITRTSDRNSRGTKKELLSGQMPGGLAVTILPVTSLQVLLSSPNWCSTTLVRSGRSQNVRPCMNI